MDPETPFIVGRNSVITSTTTGVLAGFYGLLQGSPQIVPLMVSGATNGGIAGATFFSFREYIASPALLTLLSDTAYSRRIQELQANRRRNDGSGEKLTWWDVRMNRIPDTAVSGAFTGGVLNTWKRGRLGLTPGVMTGAFVCTVLQLAFNEVGIARIKYVSRRVQEAQPDWRSGLHLEQLLPPSPPVEQERPKTRMERILVTLGFKPVSDEEYIEKLKFKRDFYLRKIAELEEQEREKENQTQIREASKSEPSGSS